MHGADVLSRTTLALSGDDSGLSRAVDELKRVPGVLTVELDADAGWTIVAHDSGVAAPALLTAARSAGVRARILGRPPSSTFGFAITSRPAGRPIAHWSRLVLSIEAILRGKRS